MCGCRRVSGGTSSWPGWSSWRTAPPRTGSDCPTTPSGSSSPTEVSYSRSLKRRTVLVWESCPCLFFVQCCYTRIHSVYSDEGLVTIHSIGNSFERLAYNLSFDPNVELMLEDAKFKFFLRALLLLTRLFHEIY